MTDWVATMTLWDWAGMALTVGAYCVFIWKFEEFEKLCFGDENS